MDDKLQELCDTVSHSVENWLEQYDWDGKLQEHIEGLNK